MTAHKVARRLAVGFALALFALMAPLPKLEFVEQAVASTVELPPADVATTEEMAEVQQAADEPLGDERVQATEEATEEFSLMAVVFDSPPEEPVMVRVDDGAGNWGEWRELHAEQDEGPDDPTNYGTEPFWVGSSEAYEVNLDAHDSQDASVVLVRTELRRSVAAVEDVAGAASSPIPFQVNPRSAWGARAPKDTNYGSVIKKAVVHHTVSSNSYSQSQVPGMIAGIQAYHQDGRGWDDIGYNFVVDKYGGIWEGRGGGIDRPVIGAHASGFNTNTVGISVLGDYSSATPSSATLEGVSRIAGWKLYTGAVDPSGSSSFTSGGGTKYAAGTVVNLPNVIGHRDVGATTCPGTIHSYLGQIRQRAQDWKNWSLLTYGPFNPSSGPPFGEFNGFSQNGNLVKMWGWVIDPDPWPGYRQVHIVLNNNERAWHLDAKQYRPDIEARFPGYGNRLGYLWVGELAEGTYDFCAVAINVGAGSNQTLGCRTVVVK